MNSSTFPQKNPTIFGCHFLDCWTGGKGPITWPMKQQFILNRQLLVGIFKRTRLWITSFILRTNHWGIGTFTFLRRWGIQCSDDVLRESLCMAKILSIYCSIVVHIKIIRWVFLHCLRSIKYFKCCFLSPDDIGKGAFINNFEMLSYAWIALSFRRCHFGTPCIW